MSDKGPNDLEATIERLEFRNVKLHQHNEKIEQQIIELRGFWMPQSSVNIAHLWLESGISLDVSLGEKGYKGSNLKFLKPQTVKPNETL